MGVMVVAEETDLAGRSSVAFLRGLEVNTPTNSLKMFTFEFGGNGGQEESGDTESKGELQTGFWEPVRCCCSS
jgi:hypothetical protein